MEGYGRVASNAVGSRALRLIASREGPRATYEFVKHDPQGENVATRIDVSAEDLFRRHVRRGSERGHVFEKHRLFSCGGPLCDPKVEDLHFAMTADEDVRRLDAPMDDAAFVRMRESASNSRADGGDAVWWKAGSSFEQSGEIDAVDELQHQIHPRVGLHEGMQLTNVRMTKQRQHACFALELRCER